MVEWKEFSLEELCANNGLVRGPFGGALKKEIFTDSGYKVYEQRNAIYETTEIGNYYISNEKYKELQRFSISEGDFVVSCSGTIGCIYRIPPNAPKGVINQALLKITVDEEKIDAELFQQYFRSEPIQKSITDDTQGGAMKNLVGMEKFKKTTFFIPIETTEQRRIAEALSDMDSYIVSLEKLIAKKRAIKQGTMQELLTGKRRLAGFSGEWVEKQIRDLAVLVTKGTTPTSLGYGFTNSGVAFVKIESIENSKVVNKYCTFISEETNNALSRSILIENDILFSIAGALGRCAKVEKNILPANTNQALAIIRLDKQNVCVDYVFRFLQSEKIIRNIAEINVQGAQANLSLENINELTILLPQTIEEQTAIAQILSDMDAEIDTLTAKLSKLKYIKQGMMSELLTGRIRLKGDTPSGKS
ncbi:restriction endonuclease subunit S [Desnuesiella massiliensis]|uniref:restriction endonuclease subunit S n=1 Tax=Desnuesiella massiliensis TaxID=1650662 RepID=UPI0006E145A1|nr:restriction endonuclease subunit S [Desnuesiella massiliensis]